MVWTAGPKWSTRLRQVEAAKHTPVWRARVMLVVRTCARHLWVAAARLGGLELIVVSGCYLFHSVPEIVDSPDGCFSKRRLNPARRQVKCIRKPLKREGGVH